VRLATRFQITKPQPTSSRLFQLVQPYALEFSRMISPVSAPQRGQGPSSTRSGRSFSLSSAAIWSTVSFVKSAMPFMNTSRSPRPCSISASLCSQSPVSSGDVSLCSSSIVITWMPLGVA
jgi:hypothetical protein